MEMGKSDSGAVAKDREVVDSLETAIEAFRKRPQGFNGPLGADATISYSGRFCWTPPQALLIRLGSSYQG